MIYAYQGLVWELPTGGGISGSAALAETQDALVGAGSVLISGAGAFTEGQDSFAAAGDVLVSGSAAVLEIQDIFSASGTVATGITGSAALVEIQDTLSASGSVLVSGAAALVEIQDSMAATGAVTLPAVTGSAALQELPDIFSAQGTNGAQSTGGHYLPITEKQLRELRKKAKRDREIQAGLEDAKRLDAADLSKTIRDAFKGEPGAPETPVLLEIDEPAINYDESDVEFLLLYG